ncbi:MAG: hypothetical protein CMP11_06225 [Zetaproteobacteria bacterium]|nr:hypothetical protein [Pseudobdellovibrionaceae bacterium]|tara:strand:+ start:187 stop:951 length:765 start_codon:yes stop_codon:yes gene_type:complete
MKKTFDLAFYHFKLEFLSLRACVLCFFFLIFNGIFFYNYLDIYISSQKSLYTQVHGNYSFTNFLSSYFSMVNLLLVLLIPATTMGSFAEDKKNGSYRLFLSSPLKTAEIVFAKYFANTLIIFSLLMMTSIYFVFLAFHGSLDYGIIGCAYLGLFLFSCAQIAYGFWVSSMCKSQLSAFILTLMGLFLVFIINSISSLVKGDGLTASILRFISTSEHIKPFFSGLISLVDTNYFVALVSFFLFLTICVIDSWRWR